LSQCLSTTAHSPSFPECAPESASNNRLKGSFVPSNPMKTTTAAIFAIVMILVGCSKHRDQKVSRLSESITVISGSSDEQLADTLSHLDQAYVFLSTDWCNGGKLTFKNMVEPFIPNLEARHIPFFVGYIGDLEAYGFDNSQTSAYTIYHLENSFGDFAYFDKKRLADIVKSVDGDYSFQNTVPLCILIKDGKVVSEKGLADLVEKEEV